MHHRLLASLCAIALGLGAVTAQAGTLSTATWTTQFFGINAGSSLTVPITATGTSSATSIAVSLTLPPFTASTFATGGVIYTFRTLTLAGAQALTATASMAAATQGVAGMFRVVPANHTKASMQIPGTPTVFRVPLSVGANGASTDFFYISTQVQYVTVDFHGWTPGTQTFTGLTLLGAALPSVVAMGSFDLTAMGGGTVLLVSPSRVSVDGFLGQQRTVSLTSLKLTFVPEPGTWLLLGAGGLALLRLRRQR